LHRDGKISENTKPTRDYALIDWRVMQAYANYWLKWGLKHEAEERVKIIAECREYRYKRKKRLMIDEAYRK
jgi:hypothetical protein